MTRKRKVTYPPAKTATKRAPPTGPDPNADRPNLARINLSAGAGRAGLKVGDRVQIEGSGLYSGEIAIIERLSGGAIPSALVRTEGGGTRQVRTIDLLPAAKESAKPPAETPPQETPPQDQPPQD
ncbi:hypothetical protein BH23CHL7_BH23CHL7_21730 [soil metagenome]